MYAYSRLRPKLSTCSGSASASASRMMLLSRGGSSRHFSSKPVSMALAAHQGNGSGNSTTSTSTSTSSKTHAMAGAVALAAAMGAGSAYATTQADTANNSTPWSSAFSFFSAAANRSTNDAPKTHEPVSVAPNVKGLSKALAQREERQKVLLGRLLKDLHELAEEAAEQAAREKQQRRETLKNESLDLSSTEPKTFKAFTHLDNFSQENLAQELQNHPEIVWEIIHGLKEETGALQRNDLKRIALACADLLKKEPTVNDLRTRKDLQEVAVVGDIHGHFDSLFRVLHMLHASSSDATANDGEHATPWNGQAAVVFNGDFVDRGDNSLDVMMSLMLLKLAYPNHVYLNRGNHEDGVLSTVYGYLEELQARYGNPDKKDPEEVQDIWDTFSQVFSALPMAVRTRKACIMHGGIPEEDFDLDELNKISSEERCKHDSLLEPADDDRIGKLLQNILWSDPRPEPGIEPNEDRGAGMMFGPDIAQRFLEKNGIQYLIRSHEPVDQGYEALPCRDGKSTVTVFSASSYPNGEGYNWGAIIRLPQDGTMQAVPFKGERASDETEEEFNQRTFRALAGLISQNRHSLEAEFAHAARTNQRRRKLRRRFSGRQENDYENKDTLISPQQWADTMAYVLGLPDLDWLGFQPCMAPTMMSSIKSKITTSTPSNSSRFNILASSAWAPPVQPSNSTELVDSGLIDYKIFLEMHCNPIAGSDQMKSLDPKTLDALMENHSMLLTVFKFLDRDGNGEVDRNEFRQGMHLLRKKRGSAPTKKSGSAPAGGVDSFLTDDPDAIFDAIDLDGSGTIELDEFEKVFQSMEMPTDLAVFKIFDADRNGSIDRNEFAEGVKLLNQRLPAKDRIQDANALFDQIDDDGSGEIDLEELRKALKDHFPGL